MDAKLVAAINAKARQASIVGPRGPTGPQGPPGPASLSTLIEARTSDPVSPSVGQMWLRTDL